jgi:uncharacterized phage protein (TIGR02218 family)
MKTLPEGMQAHLDSGATTLCLCWMLTRRDGVRFGFTDHDRTLSFDGVEFLPQTGFSASAIESGADLSVPNLEAEGALSSDALDEAALAAGRFDAATVEIWCVNWRDAAQRALLRKGALGEVKRGGLHFSAEIRGLAQALDQTVGRLYQRACDADLGDARCGVDLAGPAFRGGGTVVSVTDAAAFRAGGLDAFADAAFTGGRVAWTGGANQGRVVEVRAHRRVGGVAVLDLWEAMSEPVAAGDTFDATAGCDKSLATCRDRFANLVNFRGHGIYVPGSDWVTTYPGQGGGNDGGSLYR